MSVVVTNCLAGGWGRGGRKGWFIPSLAQVVWTGYLSPDFPLFIALAILSQEREALLNPTFDFSDILQVSYSETSQ